MALRPEGIQLSPANGDAPANAMRTTIEQIVYRGLNTHYLLRRPDGEPLIVIRQNDTGADAVAGLEPGSERARELGRGTQPRRAGRRMSMTPVASIAAGWYRQQTKAIGTITPSGNVVVERVTAAILAISRTCPGTSRASRCSDRADGYTDDLRLGRHAGRRAAALARASRRHLLERQQGREPRLRRRHGLCERITQETGIAATTSMLCARRGAARERREDHRPRLAARRRLSGQGRRGVRQSAAIAASPRRTPASRTISPTARCRMPTSWR